MLVYLASPNTQQQAEHATGMPVLLSYACFKPWLFKYQAGFSRILVDSGAFSELNSGVKINGERYADWSKQWAPHADAIAGLDDISGNWKRSLVNYEQFGGFPTIHDTDPPEILKDLITLSGENRNWLGIGLMPPRSGKEQFIRWVCDNTPDDIHIHGWALRGYTYIRRLNSVDSTNWWRDGMKINAKLPWLNYGECLEIVIKRYQREHRQIQKTNQIQLAL